MDKEAIMEFLKRKYMDAGLLWMRVLVGLGIMTHGYPKIFGGRMEGFTNLTADLGFPLPGFFAWLAALTELLGGLLLAVGAGTRVTALLLFGTMLVAAFMQHGGDPFNEKEMALLYLTFAGTLMLTGPGKYSI
ncbi:MAG: DoxX family membrane protein, partial [Candidatus Marinimicrobia bacterium]|nr:DoxX family membrane protein [Candidatus Neomarinimicrobiota bacterium]